MLSTNTVISILLICVTFFPSLFKIFYGYRNYLCQSINKSINKVPSILIASIMKVTHS